MMYLEYEIKIYIYIYIWMQHGYSSIIWPIICAVLALPSKELGVMVLALCIIYEMYLMGEKLHPSNQTDPQVVRICTYLTIFYSR